MLPSSNCVGSLVPVERACAYLWTGRSAANTRTPGSVGNSFIAILVPGGRLLFAIRDCRQGRCRHSVLLRVGKLIYDTKEQKISDLLFQDWPPQVRCFWVAGHREGQGFKHQRCQKSGHCVGIRALRKGNLSRWTVQETQLSISPSFELDSMLFTRLGIPTTPGMPCSLSQTASPS